MKIFQQIIENLLDNFRTSFLEQSYRLVKE